MNTHDILFMNGGETETRKEAQLLVEGEDYYLEDGLLVFTAQYHLRRGYCCESGCRHCPFADALKDVNGETKMPG